MRKVVYNNCYGGFNLSSEAVHLYHKLKDTKIYHINHHGLDYYFFEDPSQLGDKLFETSYKDPLYKIIVEFFEKYEWCVDDVARHDETLVKVVEILSSDKASGDYAKLAITEVNGPYRITEYDGKEEVQEPRNLDWIY